MDEATARNARIRGVGSAVIAVVATFLIALAVPALWVNRMVSDTDYYVQTMAPLARDVAIQDAVATAASDAAVERLDIQARLEGLLPQPLEFLLAPISSATDTFIRKQATAFVRSDTFPAIWDRTNRVSHGAFVTAVTGKSNGAVQAEAGTFALDLGELVDGIAERTQREGLGVLGRVSDVASGRRVTLYHSDTLARVASYVDTAQRVALLLPITGIVLAAAAVALGADRRRSLLWLGASLLVWTLLPLQAIYIGQTYVGRQLESLASIPDLAAQHAYGIVFADLIRNQQLGVFISLLIVAAALLAGPSRWAVALRRLTSGGLGALSSQVELGGLGLWVGERAAALRMAGYLATAVLLALLPLPRTIAQVWWLLGFLLVWLLGAQFFASAQASGSTRR